MVKKRVNEIGDVKGHWHTYFNFRLLDSKFKSKCSKERGSFSSVGAIPIPCDTNEFIQSQDQILVQYCICSVVAHWFVDISPSSVLIQHCGIPSLAWARQTSCDEGWAGSSLTAL
jgi:hypothetical protein